MYFRTRHAFGRWSESDDGIMPNQPSLLKFLLRNEDTGRPSRGASVPKRFRHRRFFELNRNPNYTVQRYSLVVQFLRIEPTLAKNTAAITPDRVEYQFLENQHARSLPTITRSLQMRRSTYDPAQVFGSAPSIHRQSIRSTPSIPPYRYYQPTEVISILP